MTKTQSTFKIEDEASLTQWIEKDDMLLIFDVHFSWTGSCEVLTPCFDQTYIQYEKAEDRFAFLAMEGPRYADLFESMITFSESCRMTLDDIVPVSEKNGSESNVNTGSSTDNSNTKNGNLGERMKTLLRKEHKGCMPLFLAVKGRKIISIVLGASYPALMKIVEEHKPPLDDVITK